MSENLGNDHALLDLINFLITSMRGDNGKPKSREHSLAVTKLEEAGFWIEKAIKIEAKNATCSKCGVTGGHRHWCPLNPRKPFQNEVEE